MEPNPAHRSPLDWADVEEMTRRLPERHNLVVPKERLPHAPPHRTSWMGRKKGALRQFRCHRAEHNLHIKEYADRWVVHVDRWNPHKAVLRHLLVDRGFKWFIPVGPPAPILEAGANAVPIPG